MSVQPRGSGSVVDLRVISTGFFRFQRLGLGQQRLNSLAVGSQEPHVTAPVYCSVWYSESLPDRDALHAPGECRDRARISSRRALTSSRSAANCLAPANSASSFSASRPTKKVASAAVT